MAERRMFAKTIIDSDAFIDMPITARLLYYDLSMRADDDGFVNSPKKIMRMIGASQDDLSILILRKFLIPFDNGVVVIKHWRIHNYIRKDMYHETKYKSEKAQLTLDNNNAYTISDTDTLQVCNEPVTNPSTQVRLGKVRLGKDRLDIGGSRGGEESPPTPTKQKHFVKPTLEEVKAYCKERSNSVNPERFIDYYEANGWRVGKNPMKDWKAAVRTWEKNGYSNNGKKEDDDIDEYKSVINKFLY